MNDPVSIIIAVKNGAATLVPCLDSVLRLEYPAFEVIVVDDGSTDRTPEILRGYAQRIKVITFEKSAGPSAARNQAAAQARGDFVAFTDADCIVAPDWLTRLVEALREKPEAVSCGGLQLVPEQAALFEKQVFAFMSRAGIITDYVKPARGRAAYPVRHNPSCNSLYRRQVFLDAGGFQEGLWPGEDVELDYRLCRRGLLLLFNPLAVVYHHRPAALPAFRRMMRRYGWAQAVVVKHYGPFRSIHFLPAVCLTALLGFIALLFWDRLAALGALLLTVAALGLYLRDAATFRLVLWALISWHAGFVQGLFSQKALDKKP
ncbi:MAG TPA: glycosyltransferase [Candidatus Omnitrophota bacterium]|nr:glycosyltransferase [Candidatus Omnitrophota bacterium]HRZ15813.1 glycosyltransferase [Candidatus Omnitrophota bacterium]